MTYSCRIMTCRCVWSLSGGLTDAVPQVSHISRFGIPVLVVIFVLKIFRKIQRFVLNYSSLNTSSNLATSITNITQMHFLWDFVQRVIQHFNWLHRGWWAQGRKREGACDVTGTPRLWLLSSLSFITPTSSVLQSFWFWALQPCKS